MADEPNGNIAALTSEQPVHVVRTEADPALPAPKPAMPRLLSLDAYRGLIMITLAASGFGLAGTAVRHLEQSPGDPVWQNVYHQFEHVEWAGCGYWDMIQPSFMFMVGVAMAFSYAKRQQTGQSYPALLGHAMLRSLVLILMGIFLSSRWELMNVLTQIGLGYTFLFLFWGRCWHRQAVAAGLILVGTWALYVGYAAFAPPVDSPPPGVKAEWAKKYLADINPAWYKNANVGHAIDLVILNQLPVEREFKFNSGGYQTINFIPSLATMIFGLMCGELLRSGRSQGRKLLILLGAGIGGLAVGYLLDLTGVCPIVKRIWTPSWAIFSTGWCCLILAGFYAVIDVVGLRRWAFVLVVVGMNSMAVYCMGQLLRPWMRRTWHGLASDAFTAAGPLFEPMLECTLTGLFFWLACLWLYRQRIFIRV